jgi:hypothetical protein
LLRQAVPFDLVVTEVVYFDPSNVLVRFNFPVTTVGDLGGPDVLIEVGGQPVNFSPTSAAPSTFLFGATAGDPTAADWVATPGTDAVVVGPGGLATLAGSSGVVQP